LKIALKKYGNIMMLERYPFICSYLPGFVGLEQKAHDWYVCVVNAVDDHVSASLFKLGVAGKTCVITTLQYTHLYNN